MEPIVTQEVALTFVYRTSGSRVPIDDGVSTIFSGVVKKPTSIDPSPLVQIPTKSDHFAVEKDKFISFPFLFRTSIGMDNLNLMEKKPSISPSGCSHSLRHHDVGAYHEALYQEWQREIMPLHALGCKIGSTSENKGQFFFVINIETNPLPRVGSIQVNIQ